MARSGLLPCTSMSWPLMSESAASYRWARASRIKACLRRWRRPPKSRAPRCNPSSIGILKRGRPSSLGSTRERSWIAQSQSRMSAAIFVTLISALSVASSAQRGRKPDATMVNAIARRIGLYASSNGQLMKTDCAVTDLVARRFPTRGPVLGPQGIANRTSSIGTRAAHRSDLHAPIHDRMAGIGRVMRSSAFLRWRCHRPNMRFWNLSCKGTAPTRGVCIPMGYSPAKPLNFQTLVRLIPSHFGHHPAVDCCGTVGRRERKCFRYWLGATLNCRTNDLRSSSALEKPQRAAI